MPNTYMPHRNVIKYGEFGLTIDELASLTFDKLLNLWAQSQKQNDFLYHLLIHVDCPENFFMKHYLEYTDVVRINRIKILSNIKIIKTKDFLIEVLRIKDYNKQDILNYYHSLINDSNSSWNALFKKNRYISNLLKYEIIADDIYLTDEIKNIFIF